MKSAILWAVRRVCAAVSVNATPPIWDCLSTSSRRKRTSNFPSGSRCACPMTMASARRLFHSGKLTWAISGRRADSADEYRAEAAASREVLLDDFRDALRQRGLPRERKHRDGNLVGPAPY